jgi:ADP-ribose pyrophosphatase YjhB (NUDIX family)
MRLVSRAAGEASSPAELGEGKHLGWRHRILLRLAHLWFRLTRGMTLGVRVIALDQAGRVFLVRHTYVPGWHLPGGGIETGQDARAALEAELREEGNLALGDEPRLLGIYLNLSASRRDHVLVYVARNVRQTHARQPDREIAESGFFPLETLPAETTKATRRRLAEFAQNAPAPRLW